MNLNLHLSDGFQSLGMIRVEGSMPTKKAIELVQNRLELYGLSLENDIVATVTDGASVMMRFGRETEPMHYACLAHAIHLCVCDVLYKSSEPRQKTNDGVRGGTIEEEDSEEENIEEFAGVLGSDEDEQKHFEIVPGISEIIQKVRKIVKIFRKSPVKNDEYLQPIVHQSFGQEKCLFLDCKTRWNSLLKMLLRFYEMRKEVKVAMIQLDVEFNVSDAELTKIKEICDALAPLEMAVQYLCEKNANIILAERVIAFVTKKLDDFKTQIGDDLSETFKKRVQERRNPNVVHLLEYLQSPVFEQSHDQFGLSIRREEITALATKLYRRLYKASVTGEGSCESAVSPNTKEVSISVQKESVKLNLSEEFEVFLQQPKQRIEPVQSTEAKTITTEMQLFEVTKRRPENLENIYQALLTIRPTFVEPERAFSAMGLFATKLRNRLNDDTLNAMVILRKFYKEQSR